MYRVLNNFSVKKQAKDDKKAGSDAAKDAKKTGARDI